MRIKELDVGVVAIFDGHNGAEASEMASKLFLDYFLLHVYFLLDGIYSMMFRKSTGKLMYREVAILNNVFNLNKDDRSNHGEGYAFLYRCHFWLCLCIEKSFKLFKQCSMVPKLIDENLQVMLDIASYFGPIISYGNSGGIINEGSS